MSVSKLLPAGGANDFNLNIIGATTVANFDKEYSSGSYSVTSSGNDITLDLYAYNSAGTLVGYTGTKAFTATGGFNKMVVVGGTVGDVLGFAYKTTITTTTSTSDVTSPAVIYSVSPSVAAKVDDTITITGANFASGVTVTFTGTSYTATAAKAISRTNSTTLVVTRPDSFPVTGSPYTVTVSNPGVTNPTGSNAHILSNSVTAGNAPVWSTAATLPTFSRNVAYSTTVVATDGSDAGSSIVSYSIVSGALPTSITLTSTSGVIAGTTTSATSASLTIRATDSGGNFVDRAFTMPNSTPVWSTTSMTAVDWNSAYSFTLLAPDDSGNTPTFSLVSGTLPSGLSLNSSTGVVSGTTQANATYSLTFRATDVNGGFANQAISLVVNARAVQLLLIAGGGSGGNGASNGSNCSGGGGAGGLVTSTTIAVTTATGYPIVIGAGGSGYGASSSQNGYPGNDSTGFGQTAFLGGYGGGAQSAVGGNGGSGGGGGEAAGGYGQAGQGFDGGSGSGPNGGGGAGGIGQSQAANGIGTGGLASTAFSVWSAATGTGVGGAYAGGGGGGVGSSYTAGNGGGGGSTAGGPNGGDSSAATANTGSGSGAAGTAGAPNTTGQGASGICIVRYAGSQVGSGGSIVTTGGFTYHTFTSNGTFTA